MDVGISEGQISLKDLVTKRPTPTPIALSGTSINFGEEIKLPATAVLNYHVSVHRKISPKSRWLGVLNLMKCRSCSVYFVDKVIRV